MGCGSSAGNGIKVDKDSDNKPANVLPPPKPSSEKTADTGTAPIAPSSAAAAPKKEPKNRDEAIEAAVDTLDLSQEAWPTEGPLGDVPEAIFTKSALCTLVLKDCELVELPEGISSLKNLTTLDISENKLPELPVTLAECTQLEVLDCSDNELTKLPEIVMPNLQTLDAYKNTLKSLPDTLGKCSKLKMVNCFNNKLIKLPASLSELMELEEVNFASNKLKTLPKVDLWKKLKRLAVFWNTLVLLPSFEGLESLEVLQMYDNQLSEFPKMGNHPELKEIDLNQNRIEVLNVEDLSGMPALETVQFAKNHLKVLPGMIFTSSLNFLNVSGCPLTTMPEEISNSSKLQVLFWADTKTTSLPASFESLGNLVRVNLEGNELDDPAKEMCSKMQEIVDGKDGFFKFKE